MGEVVPRDTAYVELVVRPETIKIIKDPLVVILVATWISTITPCLVEPIESGGSDPLHRRLSSYEDSVFGSVLFVPVDLPIPAR